MGNKLCFTIIIICCLSLKCMGWTHLSPYSYCGGDPINNIDPDGKDIVVLNYGNDISHQHLAMLIQDENGKWQYYSVNGNNVYVSGEFKGGRPFNDVGVGSWDTPQDFMQSPYNSSNGIDGKTDNSINSYGFNEGFHIESTSEQDAIMRVGFEQISNTRYTPLGNNCATAVQKVMYDAGLPIAIPQDKATHIPANFKLGEPPYDIVQPNINPWPSEAFKSIMQANPFGTYIHK